jgi:YHS domain-containing protein
MRLLFLSALLSSALAAVVLAAKDQKGSAPPAALMATTPAGVVSRAPVNKFCAVERENEIDARITLPHEGKTIGFCCKDCVKDFRKDPKKYVAGLK